MKRDDERERRRRRHKIAHGVGRSGVGRLVEAEAFVELGDGDAFVDHALVVDEGVVGSDGEGVVVDLGAEGVGDVVEGAAGAVGVDHADAAEVAGSGVGAGAVDEVGECGGEGAADGAVGAGDEEAHAASVACAVGVPTLDRRGAAHVSGRDRAGPMMRGEWEAEHAAD